MPTNQPTKTNQTLQNIITSLPNDEIEITLIETILEYLNNEIELSKLLNIINIISSLKQEKLNPKLQKLLPTLQSLTNSQPNKINKETITDLLATYVNLK